MIPTWYLLWIVPLSVFIGILIIALFAAVQDPHDDWRQDSVSWADEIPEEKEDDDK